VIDVSYWVGRLVWVPFIKLVGGVRIERIGSLPAGFRGPGVLVVNHQGLLEIPALMDVFPFALRFLTKRALFWIPVFGWYLRVAGYISIDRGNRQKAADGIKRARSRIHRCRTTIVVFAEGTRTHDGRVQRFKKGAFHLAIQAGVPILPISISGSYHVVNRHASRIRPGTIQVRIGELIPVEGLTSSDIPDLIEKTRSAVVAGVKEHVDPDFGPDGRTGGGPG
jgi:1-acyl-sn-glycerol-3-phosphate acyltransferase